jgi:hypothetical protein
MIRMHVPVDRLVELEAAMDRIDLIAGTVEPIFSEDDKALGRQCTCIGVDGSRRSRDKPRYTAERGEEVGEKHGDCD